MRVYDITAMNSSAPSHEDECPKKHLTQTHYLELAYEQSLREADTIIHEEEARRLQLRILLLEDNNDELNEQLTLEDDKMEELERECVELRMRLEQAEIDVRKGENDLRIQTREISNLRAELSAMNGISTDSTKLLTEKLSLAREIATIKPELEHLRCQTTNYQALLAEKLALQRQVSTLEVELETEKRAAKRNMDKDVSSEKDDAAQTKIDELRKEVAKEKREKERVHKAMDKEAAMWESQKTVLETKMEQLRTKLRTSKTQLKETASDLAKAQTATTIGISSAPILEVPAKTSRKRSAVQMSIDATIGTPDGVAVRGKRGNAKRTRTDLTAFGEKSMFSITPYLNRTISVAPDTPNEEDMCDEGDVKKISGQSLQPESYDNPVGDKVTYEDDNGTPTMARAKQRKKTIDENTLKPAKSGSSNAKSAPKKQRTFGTLEQVREEDGENTDPETKLLSNFKEDMKSISTALSVSSDIPEPKKKRRKLHGTSKTLFDEDDGEATKRPAKITLGPIRTLGKGGIAAKNGSVGGQSKGFGAFSPLKKDRRGPGASFLA